MLLTPLRRAPMMLGGVGFQAGLDEARRKQAAARRTAPPPAPAAAPAPATATAPRADVVEQLKALKALADAGALTPDEFGRAKHKVLGD
jgi:hypothetical protein